jgi:hypothetical protein
VTLDIFPVLPADVTTPAPTMRDAPERAEATLAEIEPRAVVVDALLAAFVPELI